jgi:arginine decarboxylase
VNLKKNADLRYISAEKYIYPGLNMDLIPREIFFTKGVGIHKDKLASFELALRRAGIEKCNLVYVSSIFPPNCLIIPKKIGLKRIKPGQITFCVMARNETNEPNRLISSAVGLAVPKDKNHYGYISEHHSFGETARKAGDYAEDLAATMLATTLGIAFDPDEAWDSRKQVYKASNYIFKSNNICQSSEGNKHGKWTTVIAAAVMLL